MNGDNDEDIDSIDNSVGDIFEVIKTREVNKTNEYMIISKEGLFFIKIILN
jgi:ribosomal protein S17